jgi:hypothetical protein
VSEVESPTSWFDDELLVVSHPPNPSASIVPATIGSIRNASLENRMSDTPLLQDGLSQPDHYWQQYDH